MNDLAGQGATQRRGHRSRIEPVQRESTVDLIAARLREAVFAGTLPAGAPLGEVELAAQLGVSRGPLREAAQRLVGERVLESRRRGLAVSTLTGEDVVDVYLARGAIEHTACRRVLADPAGSRARTVRALDRCQQRMVRAEARGDLAGLADAEVAFHRTLVAAAGSVRLTAMLEPLLIETRLCSFAVNPTPGSMEVDTDSPAEHAAIVAALAAGDEAACLAAVDAHFAAAVRRLTPEEPALG